MLSRAILDPEHPYTAPKLLEYVARFHEWMARDPYDEKLAIELGVGYLAAIHTPDFRKPKVWFKDTEVTYRDDNRYMWLFLEDTDDEERPTPVWWTRIRPIFPGTMRSGTIRPAVIGPIG